MIKSVNLRSPFLSRPIAGMEPRIGTTKGPEKRINSLMKICTIFLTRHFLTRWDVTSRELNRVCICICRIARRKQPLKETTFCKRIFETKTCGGKLSNCYVDVSLSSRQIYFFNTVYPILMHIRMSRYY